MSTNSYASMKQRNSGYLFFATIVMKCVYWLRSQELETAICLHLISENVNSPLTPNNRDLGNSSGNQVLQHFCQITVYQSEFLII